MHKHLQGSEPSVVTDCSTSPDVLPVKQKPLSSVCVRKTDFWKHVLLVTGNAVRLRIGMSVSRNSLFYHTEKKQNYTYTDSQVDRSLHHMEEKKNMAFIKHCRKREAFFLRSILKNRCTLAVMGKNWDALPEPMVMNDEWLTFFFFIFTIQKWQHRQLECSTCTHFEG